MGARIIEGTITLVMVYLIVGNADGFSKAIQATGAIYKSSVEALQGR